MQILYKVRIDKKTMNPINLKIVSLPINCKIVSKGQALESGKVNRDLFPAILKSMKPVQKKSFYMPFKPLEGGSTIKKGNYLYLESLRKALLGKGKPLNKISLNSNDLPLLKKLLCQCGFSKENVGKFLKELLQNNPHGEINLSQFFHKITELGPPKKKADQLITLEPSAIPYIESALRDLDLTPKEVEHVLASARVKGGALDLIKFEIKLRETGHKEMPLKSKLKLGQLVKVIEEMASRLTVSKRSLSSDRLANQYKSVLRDFGMTPKELERSLSAEGLTSENHVKSDHNLAEQISKKLAGIEIWMPNEGNSEEQVIGRVAKQSLIPTDVKTTIDQILDKVVIINEKNGPQSPLFSFSKLGLTDLRSKEKLSKEGKIDEKKSLLSPSKEKGGISDKNGHQKPESPFPFKETKLFSDLDTAKARPLHLSPTEQSAFSSGFNRGTTKEGYKVVSETKTMDISQNISSSTFSDSINTGKQSAEPVRSFLPGYLIDQVGRQISRSILRGERVIRLQLKPPELGTLRVEMNIKENILKLGMIAENSSVKELLLSNVHELREALVEQGVKLERLDININSNFGHSLANSKEGLKEGPRWGQDLNEIPFMAGDAMEDPILDSRNMAAGDRLLDLVV